MLTDFTELKILDAVFGRRAWSGKPGTLFLAAMTGPPSDTGGGTDVSGNGHTRVGVTCSGANWTWTDGKLQNANNLIFAVATADWGLVTTIGVYNQATGGTLIGYFTLPNPIQIIQYQTLKIDAGLLKLSLVGALQPGLAKAILEYLFAGVSLPSIPNFYVALGTGIGSDHITGEVEAYGYERLKVANSQGNWPAAASGSKFISGTHTFLAVATGQNYGTISHYALYDEPCLFKCVSLNTTTERLTLGSAHSLAVGDCLFVSGSSAPVASGFTNNDIAFVKTVPSSTDITLAATAGGSQFNFTGAGANVRLWRMEADVITPTGGVVDDTDDFVPAPAHGLVQGDRVLAKASVLATNVSTGVLYWVVNPTTDTFQISGTEDGTPVDFGSAGTAMTFRKVKRGTMQIAVQCQNALPFGEGDEPELSGGALEINLD